MVLLALITFVALPSFTPVQAQTPPKRIEVSLNAQRIYAFEGDNKVHEFVISSGKPWWPTPVGEFKPWIKLRSTRMQGGSKQYGTYYDLPNVPYTVFFYNDTTPKWRGFALHGTYWHNNFGVPMSHGCVNLRTIDMEKLYGWMNLNTPIKIYGTTPG